MPRKSKTAQQKASSIAIAHAFRHSSDVPDAEMTTPPKHHPRARRIFLSLPKLPVNLILSSSSGAQSRNIYGSIVICTTDKCSQICKIFLTEMAEFLSFDLRRIKIGPFFWVWRVMWTLWTLQVVVTWIVPWEYLRNSQDKSSKSPWVARTALYYY